MRPVKSRPLRSKAWTGQIDQGKLISGDDFSVTVRVFAKSDPESRTVFRTMATDRMTLVVIRLPWCPEVACCHFCRAG